MYNIIMIFEWDENKNNRNIQKHGYDFSDAAQIFDSPMLVKLDSREDYQEDRFVGLGVLRNLIVVIVFTENVEKDVIRVISIRKATKNEREIYERKF